MTSVMPDLQAIYQQTVLDHNRAPRNFRRIDQPDRCATGHNPLCGDKLTVYLRVSDETIDDVAFEGHGCAISMASASIMTGLTAGKHVQDATRTLEHVISSFADNDAKRQDLPGEMAALDDVRRFPSRIKCATLAWKTLESALRSDSGTTTTE